MNGELFVMELATIIEQPWSFVANLDTTHMVNDSNK